MKLSVLTILSLLLCACPAPTKAPGGSAAGMVIGAEFDGAPLTIGKGDLADKPVVITWFATW